MNGEQPERPALRIVGSATATEVAALVAVMSRLSGAVEAEPEEPLAANWSAPERLVRRQVAPTGWWEAGLPR